MNKSLDKLLSKVAKPVLTAAIPVVMMFAGYNSASAQNAKTYGERLAEWDKPVTIYNPVVVIEDEQSESLNVGEKRTLGDYGLYEKDTRHLDILNVYQPSTDKHYSFIYPGDLSWNKGDTLKLKVVVHKDFSKTWSDHELVDYLDESFIMATTPDHKRYHTGVITEIKDIIPGKR